MALPGVVRKEVGLAGLPKCPWTCQLTGAGLAVTVLQLLTPKFPASLELSFTCLWETPPGCSFGRGTHTSAPLPPKVLECLG